MTASVAPAARKGRVTALLAQMRVVPLDADHPAVEAMLGAYRAKFGLGPRDRATERATTWIGMAHGDCIVAACGERREGSTLEVTDAYFDGSRAGKVAFATLLYRYRAMYQTGQVETLLHTALYENVWHWKAIIRETGDPPHCLVFVHKRKAAA